MILTASINSPDRSPSRPALLPATDKSWQGDPKVIKSTGSILLPSTLVTSPRCTIFGNRAVVTATGKGSISLAHTGLNPVICPARGQVPAPSNKLPNFIISPPHNRSCGNDGNAACKRSPDSRCRPHNRSTEDSPFPRKFGQFCLRSER